MLAILDTAVVSGLRGELVRVEVDVAPGLPGCQIVGLPDAALSEARERVRSAIRNAGFTFPLSRITVNLAPADRRKHGSAYDVAIAVGILLASEELRASGGSWALLGELSLDGSLMPIPGVLPMVSTLRDAGHERVCVPVQNTHEARLVSGVEVVGADGLDDVARLIAGPRGRKAASARRRAPVRVAAGRTPAAAQSPPDPEEARAATDVTDLTDVHNLWFSPAATMHFVPTPEIRRQALAARIPATRVRVTGMPVHPAFARETRGAAGGPNLPAKASPCGLSLRRIERCTRSCPAKDTACR